MLENSPVVQKQSAGFMPSLKSLSRFTAAAAACLVLANCSSGVDPKLGVKPSPRVVSEGQSVPKGGGRDQVGKPYKVGSKTYTPKEEPGYKVEGVASWYGSDFHGRQTSNGEVFDSEALSAAHPTMPLPSYAKVTNLDNGRSITVRVNDRGPFHTDRVVDVSRKTAEMLGFRRLGKANVRLEYVSRASLVGSDDKKLLATYDAGTMKPEGTPANNVMTASLNGVPPEAAAPAAALVAPAVPAQSAYPMPPSAAPAAANELMGGQTAPLPTPSGGPYIPVQQPAAAAAPALQVTPAQSAAPAIPGAPPEAVPAAAEQPSSSSSVNRPSPASRIASAIPVTLNTVPLMDPSLMSNNSQQLVAPTIDNGTFKAR